MLADPRLTGMSRAELNELAAALAPAQAARAEQRYFQQRGGPRRKAKASHGRPLLTDANKILLTIVYQRQICSQTVLSEILEISQPPIGQAITETAKLLTARGHTIAPTVLRFTSADPLHQFLATDTVPTRPNRLQTLGAAALTGMSCPDLAKEGLQPRRASRIVRREPTPSPRPGTTTHHKPRKRHIDLLRLHKIANVLGALPKSAHPGVKKALAEIWNAEDRRHALERRAGLRGRRRGEVPQGHGEDHRRARAAARVPSCWARF